MDAVDATSLSSDGKTVAIVGVDEGGFDRPQGNQTLFVASFGSDKLTKVVDSASIGGPPAWSPNGKQLGVAMDPSDGRAGVWIISAQTGTRRLLVPGDGYSGATWTTDGRLLVVVRGTPADPPSPDYEAGIYLFKVR
jgi:Tol biopolymer transport system component